MYCYRTENYVVYLCTSYYKLYYIVQIEFTVMKRILYTCNCIVHYLFYFKHFPILSMKCKWTDIESSMCEFLYKKVNII